LLHEPPADRSGHPVPHSARPAPAPVFALLSADGYAVATTAVFTGLVGLAALGMPAIAGAVAQITSGRAELVRFQIALADGATADGHAEAVNDDHERLILLEVGVPRPAGAPDEITSWFARFGDDSRAITWLKDLEGRYLYINPRYSEQLGVAPERIRGRTDAELSQFEAIDGPRSKRPGGPEPLQLEYVIPAFDRRPAYTAMRFPVQDGAGTPIAVCGVASAADQADIANAECERLLTVLHWLHGEPAALRRLALANWGIKAVQPSGGSAASESQPPTAAAPLPPATQPLSAPAAPPPSYEQTSVPGQNQVSAPGRGQLPAELSELLQSLQRRVSELESKVAHLEGTLSTADASARTWPAPASED
jgi:PAS domain-containing protein